VELDNVVRKDAPVATTIERLQDLLDSLGFPRQRARFQRWTAGPTCHSCQLRFSNYPVLFANGKGVTPDLATASALAEFVERLQCQLDITFTRAGNITSMEPFAPARQRTLAEIGSDAPRLMGVDFAGLSPENVGTLSCLRFTDVFGRRVVDLPFGLFCAVTSSTGMAAGNTLEEALTQAICEVFERRAIHVVETGRVRGLPTIEPGALPVRSQVLRQMLRWLQSTGIEVQVKDASLGGLLPVLAVILTDHAAGTRHVSFGSDPDFDVALTRCITEAYQGTDRLFRTMAVGGGGAAFIDTFNNLEVLLGRLTESVGTPAQGPAFAEVDTNRDGLLFVVDRVRQLGHRLYVRDFSLFGFPTYYVYIEELSALNVLRDECFSYLYQHGDAVRATLFALHRVCTKDVEFCSRVLFKEITRCNPLIERMFSEAVLHAPVVSNFVVSLRTLVILMLVETGKIEEARVLMASRPIGARDTSTEESVRATLSAYLATRGNAVDAGRLRADLETVIGGPLTNEEEAPPKPLPLPRCECVYSCPTCPTRRYCRLDEWHRLARHLRAQAQIVRQEAVLDRLAG